MRSRLAHIARLVRSAPLWLALCLPGAALAAGPKPDFNPCTLPAQSLSAEMGLPRTAKKLEAGAVLTVVALGSSSTEGVGASRKSLSYPAQVEARLRRLFPGQSVTVLNKGVGGELAHDMEIRLERDVVAMQPDLVLWQTGTNDALRLVPYEDMTGALERGIKRIRALDIDVLLIGPQFSLQLERRVTRYSTYVEAMRTFAHDHAVAFFDRYDAMQRWEGRQRPRTLLASDNLHMNDEGYRCLGNAVTEAITCLASGRCAAQ